MEEKQQKKPIDNISNTSLPSAEHDTQTTVVSSKTQTNSDFDTELSNSPKKQKKIEDIPPTPQPQASINSTNINHQDIPFNGKNVDYCSFSTTNKNPSTSNTNKSESNPIQQILNQVVIHTSDPDSDEDEQEKKLAAAKKLLFPSALATSFSEVADTLRNERRQEFCPIYKDETPEQIALRQAKQKPIGSLLAKRIHWDDLKRKREEEEKKLSQMPLRYGPYGPIYANQQQTFTNSYEQYNRKMQNQSQQSFANPYEQYYLAMQNQSQQSFANPYEQYYAAVQNQYEQMTQIARLQQEYNGFYPEYQQQSSLQNNSHIAQNSMQQQSQPYTYPYPAIYSTNMTKTNTSTDYNLFLNNLMQPPPPPPPDEPYPY